MSRLHRATLCVSNAGLPLLINQCQDYIRATLCVSNAGLPLLINQCQDYTEQLYVNIECRATVVDKSMSRLHRATLCVSNAGLPLLINLCQDYTEQLYVYLMQGYHC